jgi:hypothetical protein
MSKRVLMITEWYYPATAAAAHRPAKFAKYLPRFGWTPTVLCVDWNASNSEGTYDPALAAAGDSCETIRVSRRAPKPGSLWAFARRVANRYWYYRTPHLLYRRMLAAGIRRCREQPFDVIWSSQPGHWVHEVAKAISRETGIPWVADFRDLPDEFIVDRQNRQAMKRLIKTCKPATALVTVSQPLADRLAALCRAPVHLITNGFDPDDALPRAAGKLEKFTIGYFGTLYARYQDPRPVLKAVDQLVRTGRVDLRDVRVCFYGSHQKAVERCGVEEWRRFIEVPGRLPLDEMRACQIRTAVLLQLTLCGWRGIMTSKIFGYLLAGRPILSVPGDGDVVDALIARTRAGKTAGTPEAIAEILDEWYREWKATGTVRYDGDPQAISEYSYEPLTGRLAGLLDSVAGARTGRSV